MQEVLKKERRLRVQKLNKLLEKQFPDAPMELNFSNDFECLVAVILSAQCTDKRVNEVTKTLFKKYKTLNDYAQTPVAVMEQDVFACGFYRNKARYIIGAAKRIQEVFNGDLPRTLEEMITIPGVARKTANVVLAVLYGVVDGIAVDTHIRRFAIRFNLSDYSDPKRIEKDFMEVVPRALWWSFSHRLVLYGRYICKAHPHECSEHPLTSVYPKATQIWPKSG